MERLVLDRRCLSRSARHGCGRTGGPACAGGKIIHNVDPSVVPIRQRVPRPVREYGPAGFRPPACLAAEPLWAMLRVTFQRKLSH